MTDTNLDGLWRFYEEHAAQARQHETLRASVTSTLVAVAAAIVGLAAVGGIERSDWLAGLTVVLVGLLSSALCIKHYERNRFHTKVLSEVRKEIARIHEDPSREPRSTGDLRERAKEAHAAGFALFGSADPESTAGPEEEPAAPRSNKPARTPSRWISVRLHLLWLGLPAMIALVGLLVIALALTR